MQTQNSYQAPTEDSSNGAVDSLSSNLSDTEPDHVDSPAVAGTTTGLQHNFGFGQLYEVYQNETASDLLNEGVLAQYFMCVNMKHGFTFCKICGKTSTLKGTLRHLKKNCTIPWQLNQQAIQALCAEIEDLKTRIGSEPLPSALQGQLIAPVEGFPVISGFRCDSCDYCSSKKSTVAKHSRQMHHQGVSGARMQRLAIGIKRKYEMISDVDPASYVPLNPEETAVKNLLDEAHSFAIEQLCSNEFDSYGHVALSNPAREYVMHYEKHMPTAFRHQWKGLLQLSQDDDENMPGAILLQDAVKNLFKSIEEIQKCIDPLP
ncbi:MAG TPA: hypothetical protein VGD31_08820 [Sphingobacteriaceae bacterium]